MAISLIELNKDLQSLCDYFDGPAHGDIMVKLASEALALNKQRVQETGKDPKGESYKDYSTKPMLAGGKGMTQSAFGSIAGSKSKRRELAWVTINGHHLFEIPEGYKQYRELHGRQSSFVDFTFSGRMWNNIKLVSDKAELNSGIAVIRATEELQQKKLEGNTKRRNEILGLSKSEEQRLSEYYNSWVEQMIKKAGL